MFGYSGRARSVATLAAATILLAGAAGVPAAQAKISPWVTDVFAIGPSGSYVAEWNAASGWSKIGGPATNIYAGSAGVFATDPSSGDILQYSGTPGRWTVIGGPGAWFTEGGGHLYGIGVNDAYVAEWNGPGQGWTIIYNGAADRFWAGDGGMWISTPWPVELYQYNGTPGSWSDAGSASGVFAAGRTLYRLDVNNNVSALNTQTLAWTQIGSAAADIYAGATGAYMIDADANIEQYDGTPGQWTVIGGPGSQFVSSWTTLYGLGPNGAYVAKYNGTPDNWSGIGGPAYELAAGD